MSAAEPIINAGFHLNIDGNKLIVSPASQLNDQQRQYIKNHKADILAELNHATAYAEEIAAERQAMHEIDGGIDPITAEDLSRLDHQFHNHLFGPGIRDNCCAPRHGRYCDEGRRLKDQYYQACQLAEQKRRQNNV